MNEPILDPAAFAHLLDITGGDPEFVDELVDTYLEDGVEQVAAMQTAADAGDIDAIIRPAHTLKSSSANVGAAAVAAISTALEADARAGNVPDLRQRVDACAAAFDATRTALLAERQARG